MSDPLISLADGGTITLVMSSDIDVPTDFAFHPAITVLDARKFTPADVPKCFGSNSKALITTPHLPQAFYQQLMMEVRRRKTVTMHMANKGAMEQGLKRILDTAKQNGTGTASAGKSEKRAMAEKGSIKKFIDTNVLDPSKSTAEEGKRLFRLAQEQGLTTTLGSITQAVSQYRRKHSQSARPASLDSPDLTGQVGGILLIERVQESMRTALKALDELKKWVGGVDTELETARKNMETVHALADLARGLKK
jgi:hypothetical protein